MSVSYCIFIVFYVLIKQMCHLCAHESVKCFHLYLEKQEQAIPSFKARSASGAQSISPFIPQQTHSYITFYAHHPILTFGCEQPPLTQKSSKSSHIIFPCFYVVVFFFFQVAFSPSKARNHEISSRCCAQLKKKKWSSLRFKIERKFRILVP